MAQKTMKAAVIHSFEGIEKIAIEEVPIPLPQDNEVQIKVKYSGVNPVDWKIAEGLLQSRLENEFPIILGWEVSGIVSAKGKNVKNLKEGDAVFAYCRKEKIHDGSYAEYICLNAENVALKPKKISFAEAASIPLAGLTAWQSVYDTANLKKEELILIHAGAGGVGGFAIQLAKLISAKVITTASEANFSYVKSLGADEMIDYTKENFVETILKKHPTGVHVAFDTVGGETLQASYKVVREGGRLVSIAGVIDMALASSRHIYAQFVFVQPDGKELKKIADLIDQGKLHSPRIQVVPFKDVISALRESRKGHTQGKQVLDIESHSS